MYDPVHLVDHVWGKKKSSLCLFHCSSQQSGLRIEVSSVKIVVYISIE